MKKFNFDTIAAPRHFLLRRLHSLMGLTFGAYVTIHLLINATGLWPRAYQQNVDHIHNLEPMLPLIEITAIFIPLLIHALYGLYITKVGVKYNTLKYPYGSNVRYTLQRWAGVILFLFIAYHVITLHRWGLAKFNPHNLAYQSTAKAIQVNLAITLFYLLGTWSAVFHWANGLWSAAIVWGLTTTAPAQKRWGQLCCLFGITMLLLATTAWTAFAIRGNPNLPISQTQTDERSNPALRGGEHGGIER